MEGWKDGRVTSLTDLEKRLQRQSRPSQKRQRDLRTSAAPLLLPQIGRRLPAPPLPSDVGRSISTPTSLLLPQEGSASILLAGARLLLENTAREGEEPGACVCVCVCACVYVCVCKFCPSLYLFTLILPFSFWNRFSHSIASIDPFVPRLWITRDFRSVPLRRTYSLQILPRRPAMFHIPMPILRSEGNVPQRGGDPFEEGADA